MTALPISNAMFRSLTATVLLSVAVATFAAEQPSAQPAPSKEMREKMATIHENMAACLRSEKAFAECQPQMQQNCAAMMGAQGCPTGIGPSVRIGSPITAPQGKNAFAATIQLRGAARRYILDHCGEAG